MIGMPLEKERQVDDLGALALEDFRQAVGHHRIGLQPAVRGIEKEQLVYSQNTCGALRLCLADSHDVGWIFATSTAEAAVGQEHHFDIGSGCDVQRECTAASQDFVVHVRCQHDGTGLLRLAAPDRLLVVCSGSKQPQGLVQEPVHRFFMTIRK
jgi:hypothetical protein